jgi:hypothetical protein
MTPLERSAPPDPGLASRAAELREAGHALIDRMADYLAAVEARPVSTPLAPAAVALRFAEPLPLDGLPAEQAWEDAWSRVAGDSIHLAHLRLHGPRG